MYVYNYIYTTKWDSKNTLKPMIDLYRFNCFEVYINGSSCM